MTKKDYVLIANAINESLGSVDSTSDIHYFIDKLCLALKQDNQNFNEKIFKIACNKDL